MNVTDLRPHVLGITKQLKEALARVAARDKANAVDRRLILKLTNEVDASVEEDTKFFPPKLETVRPEDVPKILAHLRDVPKATPGKAARKFGYTLEAVRAVVEGASLL